MRKQARIRYWEIVVGKIVENYKLMHDAFTAEEKAGCIDPTGKFVSLAWRAYGHLFELVDVGRWINWHIFHNKFGERALEVTYGKRQKPRKIKTSRDLAKVIVCVEMERNIRDERKRK